MCLYINDVLGTNNKWQGWQSNINFKNGCSQKGQRITNVRKHDKHLDSNNLTKKRQEAAEMTEQGWTKPNCRYQICELCCYVCTNAFNFVLIAVQGLWNPAVGRTGEEWSSYTTRGQTGTHVITKATEKVSHYSCIFEINAWSESKTGSSYSSAHMSACCITKTIRNHLIYMGSIHIYLRFLQRIGPNCRKIREQQFREGCGRKRSGPKSKFYTCICSWLREACRQTEIWIGTSERTAGLPPTWSRH
jgi:hypothetical protein